MQFGSTNLSEGDSDWSVYVHFSPCGVYFEIRKEMCTIIIINLNRDRAGGHFEDMRLKGLTLLPFCALLKVSFLSANMALIIFLNFLC